MLTVIVTVVVTLALVAFAMNFSTPEKKITREVVHRYAIADAQFEREMGVLLGQEIIGGNTVVALQNGDEIFPSMLSAIASARRSITFETYIYWSGSVGKQFSEALCDRARAGVAVAVTLDWVGSAKMDEAMLDEMRQAGIRVQRYRAPAWYDLTRLNKRTHRKLLVVDGLVGFTGGVGIADNWSGSAQDPDHWRDMHFRIEGPAVAQLQSAFDDNWLKTTGELLNGTDYFPPLADVGDVTANVFLSSPSGGSENMQLMYLMILAACTESIELAAAYFVPDHLATEALIAARRRGVDVRILVPGKHMDSRSVQIASKALWGDLLREGVRIFEYRPTMMHTKMLIADSRLVCVGSTNFDQRSFRLNDEATLNIYDAPFARDMRAVFDRDLRDAEEYSYENWRQRPLTQKISEKIVLSIQSQL